MRQSLIKALSIFILFTLLMPNGGSKAQEASPSGPIYIVQEGDSLWDIAARFHVSMDELASANGITTSDSISIGQRLVIPGLEGIQGVLTTQTIPFGESLSSLSLRYKISPQMLKRLNRITSPNELYAGYSLIIPQNDVTTAGQRTTLSTGQSMLELAILHHTDPWSMVINNDLENSWSVLPGNILRTPGEDDAGPGALPPEIVSVDIPRLTQGETAEVKIATQADLTLDGSLVDHRLNFFSDANDHYVALQGVYAMQAPGMYEMTLKIMDSEAPTFSFSQMVIVRAGDFPYDRSLPVDPATLDPDTNRKENDLWKESASKVTPEKMWDGSFYYPVDPVFAGCYSSRFGNRRSYNGGEYLYFHTGLDFCGQVGDPVYAAAPGTVVFAGLLTVRGNATMIDHGLGVYSAYMHQSEILVNVGDQVEAGQLIGKVGNTGRVEGPHLHFEVLVGGVQVNPLDWLEGIFP